MSIDPDPFREMFAALESVNSDEAPPPRDEGPQVAEEFEEPPIREELIEPPIRSSEPPPSKQEIEEAATDELLKIATQEEKALQDVRNTMRSKDTFLIRCPKGCQIRVKEQHRGRSGKCPRCKSDFVIPKKSPPKKTDETA